MYTPTSICDAYTPRNMYMQEHRWGGGPRGATGRPQPTPGAAEAPSPEESGSPAPALLACLGPLRGHPALCHTGGRSVQVLSTPAPGCDTSPKDFFSETRRQHHPSAQAGLGPRVLVRWGQRHPVSAKGLTLSGRKLAGVQHFPGPGACPPPPRASHFLHSQTCPGATCGEDPRSQSHPTLAPRCPLGHRGNGEESRPGHGSVSPVATDPVLSMTLQERHRQLPGTGPAMPVEMGRGPCRPGTQAPPGPRSQLGEKGCPPGFPEAQRAESAVTWLGKSGNCRKGKHPEETRQRFNTSAAVTQCPGCSSGMDVPWDTYLGAVCRKQDPCLGGGW